MLDQALEEFGLHPDVDLELMRPSQAVGDFTGRAISALSHVIENLRPNLVIVQGDTATVVAATLAAYFQRVPVAHVEAGLRTGDLYRPFPEEGNRRVVGALAAIHFAPTSGAASSLRAEGVPAHRIHITGNTVIDAILYMRTRLRESASVPRPRKRLVLLTMHRRESLGTPMEQVSLAVRSLADRNPEVEVLFPVHLSPAVREVVVPLLSDHVRIRLTDPLSYRDLVAALDACDFVLTDSGGIQEEAAALATPALVLRDTTERREGIDAGIAMLVGTDAARILEVCERLLRDPSLLGRMSSGTNPYGDGRAAERVVSVLREHFGLPGDSRESFAEDTSLNLVGPR
jgi:UDP-N-acetylglucosamine 2-epimerase (non-hydrolysing)